MYYFTIFKEEIREALYSCLEALFLPEKKLRRLSTQTHILTQYGTQQAISGTSCAHLLAHEALSY